MLLLLTVASMLVGGLFATTIFGIRNPKQPAKRSIYLSKRISLWSLILFILFPTPVSAPSKPKHFAPRGF